VDLFDKSVFIIGKNVGNDLKQVVLFSRQLTVNIFLQRRYVPVHILVQFLILFKRHYRTVTVLLSTIQRLIDIDIGGFLALLKMLLGVFSNARRAQRHQASLYMIG
jgi:hypothetical protein